MNSSLPVDEMIEFGIFATVGTVTGAAKLVEILAEKVGSVSFRRNQESASIKGSFNRLSKPLKKFASPDSQTYLALLSPDVQKIITGYTSYRIEYPFASQCFVSSDTIFNENKTEFEYQFNPLFENDDPIRQIGVSSFYDNYNALHYGIVIKTKDETSLSRLHCFVCMKGLSKFKKSSRKKDFSIGFVCSKNDTRELSRCLSLIKRHNSFFQGDDYIFSLIQKVTLYPFYPTNFQTQNESLNFLKKPSDEGFIQEINIANSYVKNVKWQIKITFCSSTHGFEEYNEYLRSLQIFGLKRTHSSSIGIYQLAVSATQEENKEFCHFMFQLIHNNHFEKYYQKWLERLGESFNSKTFI